MPNGRMLNKKISFDEKLCSLSPEIILIFTWIIPHLDVKGRILGDASYLKATIFPLIDKISVKKIQKSLKVLSENDMILLYGGKIKYIQFNGFFKNQHINETKEAKSTIPDPESLRSNSGVTPALSISISLNDKDKINHEPITPELEQIPSKEISIQESSKTILSTWNDFAKKYGLSEVVIINDKRKSNIKNRLEESNFNFELILEEIARSDFLLGKNNNGWKVSFDFIFGSKNNYIKIIEGTYRNGTTSTNKQNYKSRINSGSGENSDSEFNYITA